MFKSHIFGSPTIVSTDEDVSRIILQGDSNTFVPSYPKSLTILMGESSILLINGYLQRRIHGLIGSFLKSPNLKAQITRDMQKFVQESMGSWDEDRLIYIQEETKKVNTLPFFFLFFFYDLDSRLLSQTLNLSGRAMPCLFTSLTLKELEFLSSA